MVRAPPADEVHLLICEDVRNEADGKLSLMGVCGPSLIVPQVPCTIPSLCCVLLLMNPVRHYPEVEFSLVKPDGQTLATSRGGMPPNPTDGLPFQTQHAFKLYPVPIPVAGTYGIRLVLGSGPDVVEMHRTLVVRGSAR